MIPVLLNPNRVLGKVLLGIELLFVVSHVQCSLSSFAPLYIHKSIPLSFIKNPHIHEFS